MSYISKYLLFFLVAGFSWSQNPYPQDYFRNPLDIQVILSGSFAELRSNHFHAGLDMKTQGKEGLKVYASADGYVSRIKVSHFGYGKALYVTHPNGYTTVYAHLQKFSPKIESYIKGLQYGKESFEVESFPKTSELVLSKGEVLGFSGNTGGSGGPHLHFEIRDNQERPLNPMLFGIRAKDQRRPRVTNVYAYPKNKEALIDGKNERKELRLIPYANGNYIVERITAIGDIGFGIVSYDQQDLAPNKNGLSMIETSFNGTPKLQVDFKRFSFDETKHLNRYIDYGTYKTQKRRIQKLFVEKNNPLSLLSNLDGDGYCSIIDKTSSIFKINITDFNGNSAQVTIPIDGKDDTVSETDQTKNVDDKAFLISESATTILDGQNSSVTFYPDTVYEDSYIAYSFRSDTLFIDEDRIPLRKNFVISYDLGAYKEEDRDKLYVARLVGKNKKPIHVSSARKGNKLTARSKVLGTYTLAIDTEPPSIRPINFKDKKWLSNYRYLKLKIADKTTGISQYRATINNQWVLMEYDYKTGSLVYDFNDEIVLDTANNLKVIVTDNVGNSSTFEAVFYRK